MLHCCSTVIYRYFCHQLTETIMENRIEIINLQDLLQQFFKQSLKVVNYTIKRLTAAGENYGSQMLEVEIIVSENSKEKTLNVVAKLPPPNDWIRKMFHTNISFKKEIAMYKIIFPILKQFQMEQSASSISFCTHCFGARVNLNLDSDIVDDNAVLLLENLRLSGFITVDRMKGFDLEIAKLVITDLAIFHAVPVATKLVKPDLFRKKILPHLNPVQAFDNLSEEVQNSVFDLIVRTAKLNEECLPLVSNILKALKYCLHNTKNRLPPREPFATISHNDYWVNNSMIKFVDNKPVENKMIDFQLIDYGSPGNDIVFFLFSSVQKEVLDLYYDSLVKLYYNQFISTLKDLKCDVSSFSFELLQEEITFSAKTTEFFHVMDMLLPIFALKGKVKELSEMTEEDLITEDQISDLYKQRVPEIILEFAKRSWI